MTSDVLFKILLSLIPLCTAIITYIIAPAIKAYISQAQLDEYAFWVGRAVECAQQIYTPEQWKEKKEYCVEYLSDLLGNKLSPAQIDILIESAVKSLKLEEQAVGGATNDR